jgi:NTP pyrophosphatase (non-canonical NTP hydrolase)
VAEELADILIYALLLADRAGIDLEAAAADKIEDNERKYPADKARGRSTKYTEL